MSYTKFSFNDREHTVGTRNCPRCDQIIGYVGSTLLCDCGGFIHCEEKPEDPSDLIFKCDKCGDNYSEVWGN